MIDYLDALSKEAQAGAPSDVLMLTIEEGGVVVGVAIQNPSRPMLVSRLSTPAIDALVQKLVDIQWEGNAFKGPCDTTDALASPWCEQTGKVKRSTMALRVFELTAVISPRPAPGRLVVATADHLDSLTAWRRAFAEAIGEPEPDPRSLAEWMIAEGRYFLWEDGAIVAMAAIAGPTPHGIRINQVYTPPALRGRGYASNLVAALSQRMLDGGRQFCFLFADLANPTSNKIYRQIGYRNVSDFRQWTFSDSNAN
jgi:uncharacterized protein